MNLIDRWFPKNSQTAPPPRKPIGRGVKWLSAAIVVLAAFAVGGQYGGLILFWLAIFAGFVWLLGDAFVDSLFPTKISYFNQPGWLHHRKDGDWLWHGVCPDPSWHWPEEYRGQQFPDGTTEYSREHGIPPSSTPSRYTQSQGSGSGDGV